MSFSVGRIAVNFRTQGKSETVHNEDIIIKTYHVKQMGKVETNYIGHNTGLCSLSPQIIWVFQLGRNKLQEIHYEQLQIFPTS
jgi:hypothetical protein